MCINGKVIATAFDNNAERNENDDGFDDGDITFIYYPNLSRFFHRQN